MHFSCHGSALAGALTGVLAATLAGALALVCLWPATVIAQAAGSAASSMPNSEFPPEQTPLTIPSQPGTSSFTSEVLDTVIVDGSIPADERHRAIGDPVAGDFAGSYQRIEGAALTRAERQIGDILAQETGVQMRQTGGFGTFSSITLRAATAAQTGVFLDGVRLNSAGNAVVDLSTLELLNLGAIDIYRGAAPAQLGGAHIGGAVNLLSPQVSSDAPTNRLLLGVGSFGSARAHWAHQSRQPAGELIGTVSLQDSDNDFSFTDSNGTPLNPNDDERQHRNNADAGRVAALARLGRGTLAEGRQDWLIQASARDRGIPEWRNRRDNQARLQTDTVQLQAGYQRSAQRRTGPEDTPDPTTRDLNGSGPSGGDPTPRWRRWDTHHTLYVQWQDERFDDRASDIGLGAQDTRSETRSVGLSSYWERLAGPGVLALRGELRQDQLDSTDQLNRSQSFQAIRDSASLNGEWAWYSDNERMIVTPSLLLSLSADDYRRISRNDRSDQRERELRPQLALRYEISRKISLHASIGDYFREPSFTELFGNRGLLRGNQDLDPERGRNAEIGASWKPDDTISGQATVFASVRDELITTVYDTRGVGRSINAGGADVLGLELSAHWQPLPQWQGRLNVTLQDARADTATPATDGKRLPGEASTAFYARLQYQPTARWRGWVEVTGARQRFYDQANVLPADNQTQQNIGIDWQHSRWQASLSLLNLSDQNAEDFNGFPRPGRSVSLNITINL